jgi:hypothetical protein
LENVQLLDEATPDGVLALNEVLERLATVQPVVGEVVKLRFFAGLSIKETAKALRISSRTEGFDITREDMEIRILSDEAQALIWRSFIGGIRQARFPLVIEAGTEGSRLGTWFRSTQRPRPRLIRSASHQS